MNNSLASSKPSHEQRPAAAAARPERVRTKAEIAFLSLAQIRRMSREELIAVIRIAAVPLFRGSVVEHLPYSDRDTLEKLVFLARRTVENQGY